MKTRAGAALGSLLFFFLAPATVAGWIPWWLTGWQRQPSLPGSLAERWLGFVLVVAGALVVVESFWRFAMRGLGTPAPVAPPERLVVSGLYRYVRNPMYVGVLLAVLGQSLLLGSRLLLEYAALLWLLFSAFVIVYEEPTLSRTFGPSYDRYHSSVGRWLPRITPWEPPSQSEDTPARQ